MGVLLILLSRRRNRILMRSFEELSEAEQREVVRSVIGSVYVFGAIIIMISVIIMTSLWLHVVRIEHRDAHTYLNLFGIEVRQ